MKLTNQFRATSPLVINGVKVRDGVYPEVPAWYPNRAVRRAVKQGRHSRLPAGWLRFFMLQPQLMAGLKAAR